MNRAYVRLASGYILLIIAVFLIIGIYLVRQINEARQEAWEEQQSDQAVLIASALTSTLVADDVDAAEQVVADLQATASGRIALLDRNGDVVAGDAVRPPGILAESPEVLAAMNRQRGAGSFQNRDLNRTEYVFTAPVALDGDVAGVLVYTVPEEAAPGGWTSLTQRTIGVLILAAIGIAAVSAYMPRIITRPLADLTAVARRVSRGYLDARANTDTYDEVAELADAFNEMTGELRDRLRDIEHERARLEAILEHLNDGVLIVDPRGAVSLINRAAEGLLGIDRERALVRSYTEVIRDYELVGLIRDSAMLYASGRELPNRFIELGRPRRSVQAFAYPITQAGAELVIVILRDITELQRTETVRRDFVANVSHDLRTPIASLKALVETLLDGALEDETVARDFLSRMEVEVDDLARLVEELLELSRAESRRIELHQVPADMGYVIRRCVSRLQTHAEPKNISFTIDLPDGLPRAYVDPERIEQVLVNLLHNGTKFSPPGETIDIRARQEGDEVIISVADRGPGIPTDELDRVFERFYKSDQSRSNTGSGLGLAIAKHLVQLHGGRIWAESGPRGGATFHFTVPVAGDGEWLEQ
jgi:two-component system, OmpR family, phosphate regulon sensor histidine kinase PhoR